MHAKFSCPKNADLTEETYYKKPDGLLQGLDVQCTLWYNTKIRSYHVIIIQLYNLTSIKTNRMQFKVS